MDPNTKLTKVCRSTQCQHCLVVTLLLHVIGRVLHHISYNEDLRFRKFIGRYITEDYQYKNNPVSEKSKLFTVKCCSLSAAADTSVSVAGRQQGGRVVTGVVLVF